MMTKFRAKLITVHRWIGLALGLLWIAQGLTGCLLVFEPELQHAALPPLRQGPMASLTLVARNVANVADANVWRIRVLDRQGDLLGAEYEDRRGTSHLIFVEAATGRALETIGRDPRVPSRTNAWRWLYTFHVTLLSGSPGKVLIGISGLVLLSSILMGLGIGWPRRGSWKTVLSAGRWKTPSQKLYGWHRAIGLISAVVLLIVALTGAYIVFQVQVDSAAARLLPFHRPYIARAVAAMPVIRVSPQSAYQEAQELFPTARFESVVLPTPDQPVYTVRLRQPGESRVWIGTTSVVIDPVTGRVLDRYDALHAPLANWLSDAAYPVHIGEIMGLPGRLLILLSGLSLAVLGVIGLAAWWRKQKPTRRQARAPARQAIR
jgi:uncharacterized iron-regulated membrane protein